MTIAYADPVCDRCRSPRHLIVGDGPSICFPCVELLTAAAADPESVSLRLREVLSELHSDVVRLVDDDKVLAWEWQGWT